MENKPDDSIRVLFVVLFFGVGSYAIAGALALWNATP